MSGKINEQLLLYKVQVQHDSDAFALLYDDYVKRIYRFVYFKIGSKEESEDITADVFLKVWHYLQEKKDVKSFSGLVYRVARNAIIDLYRKRSSQNVQVMAEEMDYGDEGKWKNTTEDKMDADTVLTAIKKLKQEYQEILLLRYVDELSFEEIAEIVGKTNLTVRVTAHRAQKKLKELFGE